MIAAQQVRLGDVVDYQTGFPFKSAQYTENGARLLRGDNIGQGFLRWDGAKFWPSVTADVDKFTLQKGDVVVAMDRPWIEAGLKYAAVSETDLPCLLVQRVARLRGTEHLDGGFLRYLVGSSEFTEHILNVTTGTAVPHISGKDILDFEFTLPGITQQREIAAVLGALDDKIEMNRKTAATLEAMARALYRSWFVDFDPVWAKSEGRTPAHMDEATAALFPDSFGDDGLPVGWELAPIGEAFLDTIGGDWGKETPEGSSDYAVAIIRGTDFPGVQNGSTAKVPTRFTTAKKADRRRLAAGDIVLEISGGSPTQPTGRSLLITQSILRRFEKPMVPASFCRRLRPKSPPLSVIAFLHMQQIYLTGGTWGYQNQSTGISNFQTDRFLNSEFITVPPDKILDAFAHRMNPLLERMYCNESLALGALRDTLLPKLMSGELRVREAQELVEEVA